MATTNEYFGRQRETEQSKKPMTVKESKSYLFRRGAIGAGVAAVIYAIGSILHPGQETVTDASLLASTDIQDCIAYIDLATSQYYDENGYLYQPQDAIPMGPNGNKNEPIGETPFPSGLVIDAACVRKN